MPSPETVLAGRYRLQVRLGAGGMGEVWRATDEALGRTVAVKLIHPALLEDPGFSQRFHAEARTMAGIHHPGVVTVHDFRDDANEAFLVMEYVEGETLAGLLRRGGRMPVAYAMELLAQAADALQAAHARGVVHRDVKPSNLLVRTDGRVVLTDFGIARSASTPSLTATGAVLGTLAYLAPEQVLGQPATARSDIYALGLVGFECLAGQPPFARDNPFASAMARVNEAPATLPQHLPPAVCDVLGRALARDPDQRWASAAELAAACRQAQARSPAPTPAPAASPVPAPAPWSVPTIEPGPTVLVGRGIGRWWLAGTAAAAALALAVAGVIWAVGSGLDLPTRPGPLANSGAPSDRPESSTASAGDPASTDSCDWVAVEPGQPGYENLIDVGTPSAVPVPSGPVTMTLTTNRGQIEVELQAAAAPCTYASLQYLGSQGFYDGSACHRLTDEGIHVLQCGDPTGTSGGGPTYRFAEENLPVGRDPTYPAGSVAMAKTAEPATTGSQFFIVYTDSDIDPFYTVVGTVRNGMEIVDEVAAAGHDGAFDPTPGGGNPNQEIVIETLRVSNPE